MSQYKVLISCPVIQDDIGEFDDEFEEHGIEYDIREVDQELTEAELLDIIDEYDGVLAGDDEFTEAVFESAKKLKIISKWGIGVDNIDTAAAEKHGVEVTRTPGTLSVEVAEVVMGYAVMLARNLHETDRAIRKGGWPTPRGVSLAEKTFGIVGVGDVGAEVARRASAFDMEVLGNDVREIPDDLRRETGIESVDLAELCEQADFVSLNCALNEQTSRMIDREQLDRIGSDGYLINTARGELVHQDELVEALSEGYIAGAALDVFAEEPLPADSPLTEMNNVVLGSHNAQNTHQAVARVNKLAVDNLLSGLTGLSD